MVNVSSNLDRVHNVLVRTLGLPQNSPVAELRLGAHPAWNSLGHMNVILELEKEFGIRFPSYAVAQMTSPETIVQAINQQNSSR